MTGSLTIKLGSSGGGSSAWGAITGKPANVTTFGDLADAAGVLTNNGIGTLSYTPTTAGGSGGADAGKVPLLTANGGLSLGADTVQDGTVLVINSDIADCIKTNVHTYGIGVYSELDGAGSQAFHAHITAESTGSHVGYDGDMTGGSGVNWFARGILNPDGYLLYGQEIIAAQQRDRFTINAQGGLTWYKDGTTISSGTDKTTLSYATPAGTNTLTIPAETGTLALRGANTFTGLQQFTGTTHAGLRLNNLTTAERDAIASPQAGMAIWNTTAARLQLHNGSAWTAGMVRLDGDTMTGALTIGVGTNSPTSAAGFGLTNATAATAGVQSASPLFTQTGQGWKTTATAASQSVAFLTSVLPVQGTTAPTGTWRLQSSINGASAIDRLSLNTSVGTLTLGSTSGSNSTSIVIQGIDRSGTLTLSAFGSFLSALGGFDITGNTAILRMVDANASVRFGSLNGIADAHLGFISLTATAQKVSVYRLATDASNYERLALSSSAGVFSITCETAGTGADDIDLSLTPAGTGNVRFGTHSAIGAETATGFITIKDAGGTSRKLAVIS